MSLEFELIKKIRQSTGKADIELSIGDDTACIGNLLITKDIMAEDVHFTNTTTLKNIFLKLFTANVSDIASMGGIAKYALLGISIPHPPSNNSSKYSQDNIINSIEKASNYYNVKLIGGDTTSSKDRLFLSLTVIGERNKNLLKRDGAKDGDYLFLSRPTGLSRISLEKELAIHNFDISANYHYEIKAETELGNILGNEDGVTSCIDISDGLGIDSRHISEESHMMVEIDKNLLPLPHLHNYDVNKVEYIISSGEEFALLFTVAPDKVTHIHNVVRQLLNRQIYHIGSIKKGSGVFLKDNNHTTEISNKGYEHQI